MLIVSAVLSMISWFFLFVLTAFFSFTGVVLVFPFSLIFDGGTRRMMHGVAVLWAKSLLALSPYWKLRVEGKENIKPGERYVLVCNHQSMLDILVALGGLPLHFKFMAKKELFSLPFLGWHMFLSSYIPLNRSSPQSGKEALDKARHWLDKGVSVLLFPEGTRSLDGQIHKFKSGAFKLAMDRKVSILPLVMKGTGDALPKKSILMKKMTPMKLSIGKPVSVENFPNLETMIEKVRGEMSERLHRIQLS